MNDDEAKIVRLYQYLLTKEVVLKQQVQDRERRLRRKNPHPDDVFSYWMSLLRLEFWSQISGEVWNLIKYCGIILLTDCIQFSLELRKI